MLRSYNMFRLSKTISLPLSVAFDSKTAVKQRLKALLASNACFLYVFVQ